MDDGQRQTPKLKPALGLFDATAICVGAIVGGGIFVVTGIAAGYAGSALIISMLIAASVSSFTALSFAELSALFPKEGGVYEFGHRLISPFVGFLTGWMWILSNSFTGAAVSLSFAYYFNAIFPTLPPQYVAAVLCMAFTFLNYLGVRQSALLNNALVATKLAVLTFFCFFGLFFTKTANFIPFMPFQTGVLTGAFYIFFAYGGFGRVAVVAEEVKDPEKTVPKAIILSLAISTAFYVAVGAIAIGLVGAQALSRSSSPLSEAISVTQSSAAIQTVTIGGLLATASVLLTSILGVSRMVYAMARRGDMPRVLSQLHNRHSTPYYAIWTTGIIMALLALLVDLSSVIAVSTFALLFYYASVNFSALRLKLIDRKYPRILPILGAVTCVALLMFVMFASSESWIIGAAGLIAGTIYYVAKQKTKSHV